MWPVERAPALQGISSEHGEVLRLCWKIRVGSNRSVPAQRIRSYCRGFLKTRLGPHFRVEEAVIFPILGMDHPAVRKAMADHRRLQRLINGRTDPMVAMSLLEEELEAHVRFEERKLFNQVQQVATDAQLRCVEHAYSDMVAKQPSMAKEDVFWE